MFQLSPAWAGFVKGIGMVIVMAVAAYLSDAAHFTGILTPTLATLAASVFSAIESSMKAKSGGSQGLFGTVTIK